MVRFILAVAICIVVVGCGTPPKEHYFERSQAIPSDYDRVWGAVIQFFAENNVPVKALEKESGLIVAEAQLFPEEWVDCGKAPLFWSQTEPEGTFNVLVTRLDDGRIGVQVNSTFYCEQYEDDEPANRKQIACNSTGAFETYLLDYVDRNSR